MGFIQVCKSALLLTNAKMFKYIVFVLITNNYNNEL